MQFPQRNFKKIKQNKVNIIARALLREFSNEFVGCKVQKNFGGIHFIYILDTFYLSPKELNKFYERRSNPTPTQKILGGYSRGLNVRSPDPSFWGTF